MHRRTPQHDPHPRRASINPRHHLSLFIRCTANNKNHHILRFIPRCPATLNKRVRPLLQLPLDEVLQRRLEQRRVLRVDVLDALEALEAVPCATEDTRCRVKEVGYTASCRGGLLQGGVVG